jgi:hypothetical protein
MRSRKTLPSNTIGGGNTAIGPGALFNNTTGNDNIALGNAAGLFLTTGDEISTSATMVSLAISTPSASGVLFRVRST